MTETPNLHLEEEELSDYYDIGRINANLEIIDDFALETRTAIQELRDAIAAIREGTA